MRSEGGKGDEGRGDGQSGEEKGGCNGCMSVHVFRYGRDSIHVCMWWIHIQYVCPHAAWRDTIYTKGEAMVYNQLFLYLHSCIVL